jgi:hypothetical protein
MKKLIVFLMVLASLVSCGKSNSVGSSSIYGTSPITVPGQTAGDLGTRIDTNQFGTGLATYYETWAQLITHMPNVTYEYGNVSSTNGCKVVWKIFTVCSYSSSSSIPVTRTVINSSVDVIAKKNELKAIINRSSSVYQSGSTTFYIYMPDNTGYIIDTAYPLQANPVLMQKADGSGERFIRGR